MKGVEGSFWPSERLLTRGVLCSSESVIRFMSVFWVSVCYEESQNNKWTEPVTPQPQFNLRCGTEHRGEAVVWFSHRRPWVTECIGLHSARLPACCKPIHIDFLIMFTYIPRVPSWAPNGCCGTWTIYIFRSGVLWQNEWTGHVEKGGGYATKKEGGVLSD